jgi:hypothetical protein
VVQLRALLGVLRQWIGTEHRLLFRLGAGCLHVVDLIYRPDRDWMAGSRPCEVRIEILTLPGLVGGAS